MMRFRVNILIAIAMLLILIAGCSDSGDSPILSENKVLTGEENSLAKLYFKMEFDPDTGEVTINPREGQFDVTQWAEITIYNAEWVPWERNWYISAQLRNLTQYTGYGVWVVFTELGEKIVRDVDGYIYHGPQMARVPLIALRKEAEFREFPAYHVEDHTLVIHWPVGVNSWDPVEFYIDAAWPNPRKRPMVEELNQLNFPPPCQSFGITAHIQDFQSQSEELEVYIDLSSYGGGNLEPMYDDGEHNDLGPGDGIFGVEFAAGELFGEYVFTIYATDPESHKMENDITFYPLEYPPMPPIPWETVAKGQQSGIHEPMFIIIENDSDWTKFWDDHGSYQLPPPEKPVIDFETYMVVIVMVGAKPDSCYEVEITGLEYSSENCGVMVYYDDIYPGPSCACADVITYPYHFIQVYKSEWPFDGFATPTELDCNEDCLEWSVISSGTQCNYDAPNEWAIYSQEDYQNFWNLLFGGGEPPYVDFETEMVFGFTQGEKNSSGYYMLFDQACINAEGKLQVDYTMMNPAPDCNVLWVFTYPFLVVKAEKDLTEVEFSGTNIVYECD